MTPRVITTAVEFRASDGLSDLVMSRGVDGRVHISIHDRGRPGYTASFGLDAQADIAKFLMGDRWTTPSAG